MTHPLPHKTDEDAPNGQDNLTRALARLKQLDGALVDAALAYATLGIPVFPCHADRKRPLVPGESAPGKRDGGLYLATTEQVKIRAWWKRWPQAMIGVPTGAASGFVVVDLDPAPGQDAGNLIEQLRIRAGAKLAAALVAHTPRGGMHLMYAAPASIPIGNRANIFKADKDAGQIDVRGAGGYVIFPPSQRRGPQAIREGCDGRCYEWDEVEGPGEDFALPDMPSPLIDFIRKDRSRSKSVREHPSIGWQSDHRAKRPANSLADRRKQAAASKAFHDEVAAIKCTAQGSRNDRLNIAAMKLGQLVAAGLLPKVMVESALEAACHSNGMAKDDGPNSVRATIASGMKKGLSEPRDLSHIDDDTEHKDMLRKSSRRPVEPSAMGDTPDPIRSTPTRNNTPPEKLQSPVGDDPRPTIRFRPSFMHETVDHVEQILIEAGPGPIYQRNGQLVHITHMPTLRSDGTREEQQAIGFAEKAFFLRTVSQRARCERFMLRENTWLPCNPRPEMAEQFFALKQWKLSILRQIIFAPLVRPDGSLLNRQGYDAKTGLYLTQEMIALSVPDHPTEQQAARALDLLTELFSSYPFVDDEERDGVSLAVVIASLLTSVQRSVLDFAPLFGITAPKAGTGKSHVVDVIAVLATGARADCVIAGNDPEEFKKTLGSKLCEGRPLFSFDNAPEGMPLQGQYLCAALTQDHVEHRVLGFGIIARPSTCVTIFATGNNLGVRGDMARRTLICRLDAKTERPEQRTFDHDIRDEALRRRPELISALLTIIRWRYTWAEGLAGPWQHSAGAKPLAGFQRWCRLIRDPLVALGLRDPVLSVDDARATDDQQDGLLTLLEQWHAVFSHTPKTTRSVYDGMTGNVALIDAIKAVTRDLELNDPGKLGKYISRYIGTRCNSLRFERGHKSYGNQTWMVVKEN